jgi:outer membrane protein assembly factor BamD
MSVRRLAFGAAFVGAAFLGGCSSGDPGDLAFVEIPPEQLYNEGLQHLSQGDSAGAAESFDEIDRQHPYSEWARRALVMSAYTHFERGNYDEAVISARRYVTIYPNTDDAPYMQYIVGESYFQQMPDITRDQEMTERSLAAMTQLIARYPDSPYAVEAQRRLDITRDQLAGKEMETGRFYLERRNYIGAINRFKVVVTSYQTTRHVEEALERLTEAYLSMGVVNEAQTAAAVLGHNFPESRWYRDAYSLLQSGGLEPREDADSWISRAFRTVTG